MHNVGWVGLVVTIYVGEINCIDIDTLTKQNLL